MVPRGTKESGGAAAGNRLHDVARVLRHASGKGLGMRECWVRSRTSSAEYRHRRVALPKSPPTGDTRTPPRVGVDHALRSSLEVNAMKRFPIALMAVGLLALSTSAPAACRPFGTQIECDLGRSELTIGTQRAPAPAHARAFQPQSLQAGELLDDRPASRPFRFELQNIGSDPSLCRKIGNETYCY